MTDTYFLRRSGKVSGPHSVESIKSAVKSKKVTSDDLVSTSKDGPWKKLKLGTSGADDSQPPPVPKERKPPESDDPDWMDEPIEEAGLEDDGDLPPLPVSPRKLNRKKREEVGDEKADRKKKPRKVKESGTAGLVLRIVIWVAVGMAITAGLGVTFLTRNATETLAKRDQKETPAKNDAAALKSEPRIPQIDRIVIEIDASLSVGMIKEQITRLMQQLATEIQVAQSDGKKVGKYQKSLEIYKDAILMWDAMHKKQWQNGQPEKYPGHLYLTANNQVVYWEYGNNKDYLRDAPPPDSGKFAREAFFSVKEYNKQEYDGKKTVADILNRYDMWDEVTQEPLEQNDGVDKGFQAAGAVKHVRVPLDCFFKLTAKARAIIGR